MKRKRGAKKAPKKGKRNDHAELNDAATVLVSINIEDTTCLDQNKGPQHDCEMDIGPPVGVDKLNDISIVEAVHHKDNFIGQSGPVLKVKLKSSKALGHHRSQLDIQTFSSIDKSNQQGASENNTHGEKEDNTCSDGQMLDMQNDISEMIAKIAGSIGTKSSEGIDLLSEGIQDKNLNVANGPMHMLGEKNLVHADKEPYSEDSCYNEKELRAALMVIKKIMKMNAAEPFNAPVDPVALGLPDYFDIIETPMDFGTICHDLEHGYKYANSKDVFKDVQFIWKNCNKYNNKGDYIMDLMSRVEKNFMKYWITAQLYVDKPNNGKMESSNDQATVEGGKRKAIKKKTLQDLESDVPSKDDPSVGSIGVVSPTSLRTGIDAFGVNNASFPHDPADSLCMDVPMDPPSSDMPVDPPCSDAPVDPPCKKKPVDPPCRDISVNPPGVCGTNTAPAAVPLVSGSSSPHPTVSTGPSSSSPVFVLSPRLKRGYRPSRCSAEPDTSVGINHVPGSSSSAMPENSRIPITCKRRGRGPSKPSSCRPKAGEGPFILIWVGGAPVGDHAHHFGRYCAEEAKTYLKYPLHLGWDTEQMMHVHSFYYSAQRDYRFVGEEDPNNEGQRFPVNEQRALIWIKDTVQNGKREWRNTIKYEYYKHWVTADDVGREAILNSLPSRVPKEMWPLLCSYFERPEKQAEAKRNSRNCKNMKKPMARSTQGSISLANANYRLKKELRQEYNPAKAWVLMHQSRDPESVEYRKKFEEAVNGLSLTPDSDPSVISPVLDAISGGHHGGYERGIGRGYRRKSVNDSLTPLRSYNELGAHGMEMKRQMEQQQQQIKEQQQQMQDARREMEEQRRLIEKLQRRLDRQHASSSRAPPALFAQPAGFDLSLFLNAMTTACLNFAAMRPPVHTSSSDSNRRAGGADSSSID